MICIFFFFSFYMSYLLYWRPGKHLYVQKIPVFRLELWFKSTHIQNKWNQRVYKRELQYRSSFYLLIYGMTGLCRLTFWPCSVPTQKTPVPLSHIYVQSYTVTSDTNRFSVIHVHPKIPHPPVSISWVKQIPSTQSFLNPPIANPQTAKNI